MCNGEIYNSPQLRKELAAAGHAFKTSTDVEVILHLFEEHGRDCVKHLHGMFAFAIWDNVNKSLFLARDHMGQKPLFFAKVGEKFLFASEAKALLATGLVKPEIDVDAQLPGIGIRISWSKGTWSRVNIFPIYRSSSGACVLLQAGFTPETSVA